MHTPRGSCVSTSRFTASMISRITSGRTSPSKCRRHVDCAPPRESSNVSQYSRASPLPPNASAPGTPVELSLLDETRGEALQLLGVVARVIEPGPAGGSGGLGIKLLDPPEPWQQLVERVLALHTSFPPAPPIDKRAARRL